MEESLKANLEICERKCICWLLEKYGYDKIKTAKALKIGMSSLYRKMVKFKIAKPPKKT